MPRVRRKIKVRILHEYTDRHIYELKTGCCYRFVDGFFDHKKNDTDFEAMKKCWAEIGKKVLADFIEENPGKRPFAWWKFSAREPRKLISGIEHPESGFGQGTNEREYYYGVPNPISFFCDDRDKTQRPVYETQFEYLKRLNLLTDYEKSLVESGEDINDVENRL